MFASSSGHRSMEGHPLLTTNNEGAWLLGERERLTQAQFLYRVQSLADQLPDHRYAIIVSRGRRNFLTAFCAAMVREQTALLPVNDTNVALMELAERYSDCYVLADEPRPIPIPSLDIDTLDLEGTTDKVPKVALDHVIAILQTSGSTGDPQPHRKTWGAMLAGADRWRRRFDIDRSDYIVATVPPQHMYGLESSVVLPLHTGASVFAGQPIYPADVAAALVRGDGTATLMTTPTHLSACGRSNTNWPPIRRIVSSTASLDPVISSMCEQRMRTKVFEIFGSTETGAVAARRSAESIRWSCLDGLKLDANDNTVQVRDLATGECVAIDDAVQIDDDDTFELSGRSVDMLKVAGKRASMADLSLRLNRIDGVDDGVFVRQMDRTLGVDRLIALVVAPTLSAQEIRANLARQVDPVFLPRRILRVEALPRSETGKLSKRLVEALIERLTN